MIYDPKKTKLWILFPTQENPCSLAKIWSGTSSARETENTPTDLEPTEQQDPGTGKPLVKIAKS